MTWNKQTENDVEMFFLSSYIMWILGMMEPVIVADLDSLTPPGNENWKQLMERRCCHKRRDLQAQFLRLCEEMSDEEALEFMIRRVTEAQTKPTAKDRTRQSAQMAQEGVTQPSAT